MRFHVVFLIVLAFISISFVNEIVTLDLTLELRGLVFAILVCFLILYKAIKFNQYKNIKFLNYDSLSIIYGACIFLSSASLIYTLQNTKAFHYGFVSVGMFLVYIFFRATFSHRSTENTEKKNNNNLIKSPLPPFPAKDEIKSKGELLCFVVVIIGFANALVGVVQYSCGKDVIGTFGVESFYGCFLAVNVPIAFGMLLAMWKDRKLSIQDSVFRNQFLKFFSLTALLVIIGVIVLTKSRTALIGLGLVLPLMLIRFKGWKIRRMKSKHYTKSPFKRGLLKFVMIFIFAILVCFCGKILYKLKPMSASGRGLIWKVSADMIFKNPVSGVGFGNLANQYNLYQADFFDSEKGSVVNKMTAGQVRHAYNWYLETAAEFGIFGLIVFGIFWWLILREVYKVFSRAKVPRCEEDLNIQYSTRNVQYSSEESQTDYGQRTTDYLTLGMAGSVLCFMIMCLFQFPNKIIPTFLIFNVALAWIVNANFEENSKTQIIPQHTRGKKNK